MKRRIFTNPVSRKVNEHWREIATAYLAEFRASYGRFINDPWWTDMIAELSAVSPEFREIWPHHDVVHLSEGHKLLHHPIIGDLDFDILWLQTVESGDLRLLFHTPRPETDTAAKIQRLMTGEPELALP